MTLVENSTALASNATTDFTAWLLSVSMWLVRLICPLLIVFCPLSNWACIRTFQSRVYARSSTKWYFINIAIFDTIYVLVTATLIFLLSLNIYILNWHTLLCKLIIFLNYLACQISAGLLACLSIDRLVATSFLSLYRQTCTTHLSKAVCGAVIVIFSAVNSHYLIGYNIDSNGYCSTRRYAWYEAKYSYFNVVYLLSYSIIPFTIITICNLFIVTTVCRNKSRLRKKYDTKKSIPSSTSQQGASMADGSPPKASQKPVRALKFEQSSTDANSVDEGKHDVYVSVRGSQVTNSLLERQTDCQSHRVERSSEKLLLNPEEFSSPMNTSSNLTENGQAGKSLQRERSLSTSLSAPRSSTSQKMGVQLQITISLLAVSICFILCTLPNCISTIMIQNYANDEHVRKVWQALNYLSIIPLLITHSVNLFFYYLSSNMFRECFRECYLKKKR